MPTMSALIIPSSGYLSAREAAASFSQRGWEWGEEREEQRGREGGQIGGSAAMLSYWLPSPAVATASHLTDIC